VKNTFKHKEYAGSIEVSTEDGCLHGQILFIRDLITYEAATVPELEKEFRAAVDDYLETCRELNVEPKKPYSGTFNVRIGPELHQQACEAAFLEGTTLNEYVRRSVEERLKQGNQNEIRYFHVHQHSVKFEKTISIEPTTESELITHEIICPDQSKTGRNSTSCH
jgi:predicted HicB family RNase H-like nuclease